MSQERIDALSRRLADPASRRGVLRLLGIGVAGTAVAATVGVDEVLAKRNRKGGKSRKQGASGNNPLANIPVTGTAEAGDEVFTGTLTAKKFVAGSGDQIEALAQLEGTLTKKGKEHQVTRGVRVPVSILPSGSSGVSAEQLTCEVLHLELGPLDLNLLGLQVHLDQVVLDITADPSGGLLGQLLCALADGGPLAQIVDLLNQILGILQGL
jgi:hypothetical protein